MTESEKYFGLSISFPPMARVFVASTWYETEGMSKRERLYCKCREIVSGDRAESLVFRMSQED